MHNVHLKPPRRWDSDVVPVYRRVLRRVGGMDAMVTLTGRQRDDIAARRGRTSNLFVVPNPVLMPDPPPRREPRDPNRVTVIARLERQKRLGQAIAAFEEVVEAVPGARLDVYGDGTERPVLEAEIARRSVGGAVTLHGFDPRAREALWTSSAFLMTSDYEGYPLSTLESMSRGCPVVSYDIEYGPREQITDGVDGFLVPRGDRSLLARRVIELLRSPELVRRMSAAARVRAESYGPAEFLASWASVLQATIDLKPAPCSGWARSPRCPPASPGCGFA
jgi:poly(glycerol-phosphate) alpha-glucosyltransferase